MKIMLAQAACAWNTLTNMKNKYRVQRMESGKWMALAMRDITIETDSQAAAFVNWCKSQDCETEFRAQIKTALGWITVAE